MEFIIKQMKQTIKAVSNVNVIIFFNSELRNFRVGTADARPTIRSSVQSEVRPQEVGLGHRKLDRTRRSRKQR